MCGICGLVDPSRSVSAAQLREMSDSMKHRGPDAEGVWVSHDRQVGFGHRRLSVIDLDSRSNQPFLSDDCQLVITFNGEIYNFLEIRHLLKTKGHRFRTSSDTEMILHAYQEWGTECVHRFRGMFAFGLYDIIRKRLWLVRDRLGKKPLLYYCKDGHLAFASEFQALLNIRRNDASIDISALYDCLTYNYIPAPKTAYRHIRKLRPGQWLLWEDGQIRLDNYWDVTDVGMNEVTEETAIRRVRDLLDDAVRLRMISDVPIGVLLSGGLDSSAVTYFANKHTTGSLHTFSIGFDVPAFNELADAKEMAKFVGSEHTAETYKLSSARKEAAKTMHLYGEPHGDSSIFPTAAVSRIARKHVTVALAGDGGDEVFWGYRRYLAYARHQKRSSSLMHRAGASLLRHAVPIGTNGRNFALRFLTSEFDLHTATLGGLARADKLRLLAPDLREQFRNYDDYWAYREHWRPNLSLASRLQYLDLKTYLAEGVLMKVDRASMSVSLESRAPLLDHLLVAEVFSWPDHIRSDGKTLKHLFRKALMGLIPDSLISKPKKGFSIPWRSWVRDWGELKGLTGDGRFFRKGLRLPTLYTVVVINDWLKKSLH